MAHWFTPVHWAVRAPILPVGHAPLQNDPTGVGLAQLLNVPPFESVGLLVQAAKQHNECVGGAANAAPGVWGGAAAPDALYAVVALSLPKGMAPGASDCNHSRWLL